MTTQHKNKKGVKLADLRVKQVSAVSKKPEPAKKPDVESMQKDVKPMQDSPVAAPAKVSEKKSVGTLQHISEISRPEIKVVEKHDAKKKGDTKDDKEVDVLKHMRTADSLDEFAKKDSFVLAGRVVEIRKEKEGRPTVMTQVVVQKLEQAFAYDCTVEEACLFAGISPRTYYNFLEAYPDFMQRVEVLRQAPMFVARRTILAAVQTDTDTAMKYAERKNKKEFSLRTEVAHSGEVVNRHQIDPKQAALIRSAMGNFMARKKK